MRRLPAYLRPLWLVLIVVLGCDGGNGPSAGNLTVTVLGVPAGSSAAITVTGPGGFSQPVTATQTFTQVTPGTYTVAASSITVGASEYAPSPPNQTVTVNGSVNASVLYAPATGNLAITVSGLGTASSAAVTVTGPNSYTQAVTASTTILGLTPGSYTVSARDTTATGGTSETASPNVQVVSVQARQTASANVTYTPPPNGGSVNLRIAGIYLTQSAQNYAGSVPLVKGRNGYLRVFVVANNANTAAPAVRVRFFNGGALPFDSTLILSPGLATPTVVDESSLSYSWNFPVPGNWILPGFAISAEVDPANAVAETIETDNVFPAAGTELMDVRVVPAIDVVFVPILQKGIPLNRRVRGNVTAANQDQYLQLTQRMHPIESYNATVHADYTTFTLDTLQADNGNGAWGTILGELDAVRVTEHSPKYYYGVVKVSYTSGVAGVAYVSVSGNTVGSGARAALGWDWLPSGGTVAAHELGHNWGRNHAPCGGPLGIDPQYPHADGSTGTYGVDVSPTPTLEPATDSDIMGYCANKWISDYTYKGVLTYLLNPSPPQTAVASQSV
ncbi:MAG TPA: zinc-dependent metalloprotease family protein, partial [Anaerolineales bacterium]